MNNVINSPFNLELKTIHRHDKLSKSVDLYPGPYGKMFKMLLKEIKLTGYCEVASKSQFWHMIKSLLIAS